MTTYDPDRAYDAQKDEYGPHSTKESRRIQDEERDQAENEEILTPQAEINKTYLEGKNGII